VEQQGLRILIVEDEQEFAEALSRSLRKAGHEVQLASDGASALEATRYEQPDVVFFELELLDMNGYAVARGIQEHAGWKRPLLVAFTGQTDRESCRRTQEVGIDLLLSKPVDLALLRNLLRRFQSIVQDVESFDPGL